MRHILGTQQWVHGFVRTRVDVAREQTERGSFLEYLAVLVFIATITATILAARLDLVLGSAIKASLVKILSREP